MFLCADSGLLTGQGGGLQIVQQGLELALLDDVLAAGGTALRVEGTLQGASRVERIVHQGHQEGRPRLRQVPFDHQVQGDGDLQRIR